MLSRVRSLRMARSRGGAHDYNECGAAEDEHAAPVEGIGDSQRLTFNGGIAKLCEGGSLR